MLSIVDVVLNMLKYTLINRCRELTDAKSLHDLIRDLKKEFLGDDSYPLTEELFATFLNLNKSDGYRHRAIPKRSGGWREIEAPYGNLKWIQICIFEILKALYASPSQYAYGFVPGRNVVDNAAQHIGKQYVYNIDLTSFFTYISMHRVAKCLQQAPFNFTNEVASEIATLCSRKHYTYDEKKDINIIKFSLPQGSPTSPILSNVVCESLDRRLAGLAQAYNVTYTRYADDITFSSDHNVYQDDSAFILALKDIIKTEGFVINTDKVRLQHRSVRQEVTGIIVNKKINLTKSWIKELRAVLHIWQKYGKRAAIASFYPHYREQKGHLDDGYFTPDLERIIGGKLCYMKMVKGADNAQYQKLAAIYKEVERKESVNKHDIEYVQTMPIADFERRYHVKIEFARKKSDGHPYGKFMLGKEFFLVGVSRHIDIDNIPSNAQISLCRIIWYWRQNAEGQEPVVKWRYILHHPLRHNVSTFDTKSKSVRNTVLQIAAEHPFFGFTDDSGIIEDGPIEDSSIEDNRADKNLRDEILNSSKNPSDPCPF